MPDIGHAWECLGYRDNLELGLKVFRKTIVWVCLIFFVYTGESMYGSRVRLLLVN